MKNNIFFISILFLLTIKSPGQKNNALSAQSWIEKTRLFDLSPKIPNAANLVLWYSKPATNWESEALPIGNGRFGGMIFGDAVKEHIQFNDISLWTGNKTSRGAYQNFGEMYIDFTGFTAVTNYRRELNIDEAIARVNFKVGTETYTREYFTSYPDNIMVMRFISSKANALNFSFRPADAHAGGA